MLYHRSSSATYFPLLGERIRTLAVLQIGLLPTSEKDTERDVMKDVTYGRRSLRSAPGFRILGKKEDGLMQIAETIASSMFIFEKQRTTRLDVVERHSVRFPTLRVRP